MKILEIINTDMQHKERGDRLNIFKTNKTLLGKGAFAKVFKGDDDIEVTKVELDGGYNQGSAYDTYVKAIIEDDLSSKNPYFPRIYVRRSFDGDDQIEYEMEELKPLQPFLWENPEYVSFFAKKIFSKPIAKEIGNDGELFIMYVGISPENPRGVGGDPLYNQAIEILKTIQKKNSRLSFDLHTGNYMVRLTNTGPQLVITDPFS